ncbi:response regulator [Shimia biformata]|uniref:response regulator n=1 Tax=Shimia biformata TaxID=1294299 RepID=UPI00194FC4FB|nr:response regulator [Shimia biformata]
MLKTILHVEDNADIRDLAKISLVSVGGYELYQFESGEAALAAAPDLTPDIILLDLMMPGMNGETTLKELRKIPGYWEIPAVFLTARAAQSDYDKLRELGAADVIVKPFNPIELPSQVAEIWNKCQQTAG